MYWIHLCKIKIVPYKFLVFSLLFSSLNEIYSCYDYLCHYCSKPICPVPHWAKFGHSVIVLYKMMSCHHILSKYPCFYFSSTSSVDRLPRWSEWVKVSVVSDSLWLYSPCNSPGQNTGVGSHSLLQEIFPTQGLNPGLPHCRQTLYQLSHKGSPWWC